MTSSTAFTVLIERRAHSSRWPALVAMVALLAAAFTPAIGQTNAHSKLGADVRSAISAPITPTLNWVRDVNGVRYVKALVVATSGDPEMLALREAVTAAGGSVYFVYTSVAAMSVMLPAHQVDAFASRADVQSVSANRLTARSGSSYLPSAIEATTGAATPAVRQRTQSNSLGYSGLDGSGVGIAIVDSGVMWKHQVMNNAQSQTRVKRSVNFLQVGDAAAVGAKDWTPGVDAAAAMYPGSPTLDFYESMIDSTGNYFSDDYGHGTHVAAIAAGRDFKQELDTTGIAPNANVFDVRVLDEQGFGQLSDVLAGIDWVIFHAKQYNIRVMNLSLAADSTDSVLNDPLARAVRSATAAGITVVVAAGNFGQSADGAEVYGSIGSPGNEPTAITVGSSHMHATLARADDSVNFFSSRGPTRGGLFDASGLRVHDDLIKPDLVAPGNRIVGALATDNDSMKTHNRLAALYPALAAVPGANQQQGVSVMMMSGTSVSAPVVSGAVALMLQANPGPTPPLIKAILQYSAQALPTHNLMQQGAGLLNIDGAVRLAKALRQDVGSAVLAGSIAAGAPMLAEGASLPVPSSTVNGVTFPWSRIVTVGGAHLVSGDALFTAYQPIYDPRLAWFKGTVQRSGVTYWPASQGFAANTYVRSILRTATSDQFFLTPGVVDVTALAGESSSLGRTGLFMPTATLAGWLDSGSGVRLRRGIVLSEGLVISEGLVMSEACALERELS